MKSFQPFIGREVVVSGLEFEVPPKRNRTVMKRQIGINSATDISFADKSEKDPFAVPALDVKPLSLDSIQSAGPRKAVGRVIARWSRKRVIVKNINGDTLMAEFRDGIPLPGMGEMIEVSGTPETDLYRIHLLRAVWRKAVADCGECAATKDTDTPKQTPIKAKRPLHNLPEVLRAAPDRQGNAKRLHRRRNRRTAAPAGGGRFQRPNRLLERP